MDITLEMVDQVRERTGATYEAAKKALSENNCSVVDAIIAIEKEDDENSVDVVEKIKSAVQKGNVTRIRVMRGKDELMNIPVTVGVAGGVLGLVAGPWVLISAAVIGAVAKFGFDCSFQLVKSDGTVDELAGIRITREDTEPEEENPAADAASEVDEDAPAAE